MGGGGGGGGGGVRGVRGREPGSRLSLLCVYTFPCVLGILGADGGHTFQRKPWGGSDFGRGLE